MARVKRKDRFTRERLIEKYMKRKKVTDGRITKPLWSGRGVSRG